MKKIELRPNGTKLVHTVNEQPPETDQSFGKECDINHIVKKFIKTGQITHLARRQGFYGDQSQIPDFQTAMDTVTKAQQAFDELPAHIRKRFANSPHELMQFLQDPKNQDEAISLGLMEMVETPQQAPQSTTNQTTTKPAPASGEPTPVPTP